MKRTSQFVAVLGITLIFALSGCSTGSSSPASTPEKTPASSSAAAPLDTPASSAVSSASEEAAEDQIPSRSDAEITEAVLKNFARLAGIPRQTGNEQQVSSFLKDWAENHDFTVTQDAANNIIFDVPATNGLQDLPLVGLHAHMDMTCIANPGINYNPSTDPIALIHNDATDSLSANGTTLGADGGMGIALIMDVCDNKAPHGPLRVFFTTGGENDYSGVNALDPSLTEQLSYLIDVDGEESDAVTVSSAGSETFIAYGSLDLLNPTGNTAATITLDGLLGGRSDSQIGEGRCNAAIEMASLLRYFSESQLSYELASLDGGTAEDLIPSSATAVVVYSSDDTSYLESLVKTYQDALIESYGSLETSLSLRIEKTAVPEWILTKESASKVLSYALGIDNGVYAVSGNTPGFIESSSNLGLFNANANDGFIAQSLVRSADLGLLDEIIQRHTTVASDYGFDTDAGNYRAAWPYNPNSKLRPLCEKAYSENQEKDIRVVSTHSIHQCGWFADKNSQLDIVSIGPTINNARSTDESLQLSSVPITWHVLTGMLAEVE